MSNERADEFSGWAGKLEEQGALDGLGLGVSDKEAVWDRLYVRMGGPRRRRPVWYWVAAAVLLLAVCGGALLYEGHRVNRKEGGDVSVTKPGVSVVESKQEIIVSKPVSADAGIVAAGRVNGRSNVGLKAVEVERPARKSVVPKVVEVASSIDTVAAVLLAEGVKAPIQVPASPFDKKLKVVSINEIQSPEQEQQLAEQKRQRPKFRIQFGNPGSYRPAMATSQPAEKSGVFIKLSSQNP